MKFTGVRINCAIPLIIMVFSAFCMNGCAVNVPNHAHCLGPLIPIGTIIKVCNNGWECDVGSTMSDRKCIANDEYEAEMIKRYGKEGWEERKNMINREELANVGISVDKNIRCEEGKKLVPSAVELSKLINKDTQCVELKKLITNLCEQPLMGEYDVFKLGHQVYFIKNGIVLSILEKKIRRVVLVVNELGVNHQYNYGGILPYGINRYTTRSQVEKLVGNPKGEFAGIIDYKEVTIQYTKNNDEGVLIENMILYKEIH